MRKLVLGDTHLMLNRLRSIINKNRKDFDKIVFLGDYFDHFVEGYEGRCRSHEMATWLKENLDDPDFEFLLGNHDIAYRIPGYYSHNMCGFTALKNDIINGILQPEDWRKFKMFHLDGEWLLSHAGFNKKTYPVKKELLESFNPEMVQSSHPWLRGGADRGFLSQEFGGPLWLDWKNISNIPGVRQIVGHTPGNFPKVTKNNFCIDTGLNFAGCLDTSSPKGTEFYTFQV